ncbi:hypothetical protein [Mesorhizobium sp.]|uniref:hypothetical protein n=1 Tax=Mesorhizobium sp. TaxID=1871066 RepID=UPI0025D10C2C|nr:hypothetical protein [Mesorhizobium sp.]
MHGLSFPEFACHFAPTPPKRARRTIPPQGVPAIFLENWFDQLGLTRPLQQILMNGKETAGGALTVRQFVDFNGFNLPSTVVAAAFPPFAAA